MTEQSVEPVRVGMLPEADVGPLPDQGDSPIRSMWIMPCGVMITGKLVDSWLDARKHRKHCPTCGPVSYTETIELFGKRRLERERNVPEIDRQCIVTRIILHEGIVPPMNIITTMVHGHLEEDEKAPGRYRMPEW
jgi:hypothetical protein